MLRAVHENDNGYSLFSFRQDESARQFHPAALERCFNDIEFDAFSCLVSEVDLVRRAIGERGSLAVRPVCPSIGAGPRTIWSGVELPSLTTERKPAQTASIGGSDIDRLAAVHSINAQMAVGRLGVFGSGEA